MTYQIPEEQFERLTERALAAGYANVPALLEALSSEPIDDPRGALTENELRRSVADLEVADALIDAGNSIDSEQAFKQIVDKHAISLSG